ncbi:transferrin-binding protein-like solute binding protein [Haemophilus influenzae]|uniref:transferrin-binding protein-like solute binding protein n=2 Tax=Haemophilus influenzae TaxID=727 RepID=UPI000A0A6950|nr:transferrin-binding protein-like solute binding protein [Haemophilus influenzae]AXP46709.1 transferrin-binding protein-like solute binding protein [Haemophilus influenzae]AXP65556.1 transferrin-binding protein-like solute binding protein [Haemophilus influenzae]MCK8901041.1 transferrin-binding protein-like solute binding protein [Haemophilus influenzae]MCK8986621.1 transferrin-binding protein-like solute binding protein [Haemophilus influenzae]MCK9050480.1 transferrin-binding protein-like s
MKSVPLISGGLSFLLSACSGGGSFDVDNVSNPSSSKPRYQDDTSSSRKKSDLENLSIPSLGGGMKLVAQNLRDRREPSFLNENGYMIFSSLSTIEADVDKQNTSKINPSGSIDEPNATNPTKNDHGQKYVYSGLYYIPSSWRDSQNKFYSGYYGYAYYFGKQTATTLPVDGVATYKGTWSFITAAKNGKTYPLFSNSSGQGYSKRSAIPEDIDLENAPKNGREKGLVSEFSANFGTKKLKGELFYTKRENEIQKYEKEKLYDIDADIYSNRFRGTVKPTKKETEEHPFTSEGTLEGGFYGPNGEELGGKFLAGDNRVFGVFSAKETEETEKKKLSKETLIDGKLTTFKTTNTAASTTANTAASTTANTAANAKTNTENFTTKDIPSFGEADYLLIDNYPVPLLPEKNTNDFITSRHHTVGNKTYKVEACCSNLSYVKFGMYYEDPLKEENEKDKEKHKEKQATKSIDTYYQFLLGHRTASSKIPTMGNVKYRGSWFGYIGDDKTSYSATGGKNAVAEFDVNFADKTLKGVLKRHDNGNPVFTINANFQSGKNDFTGTATAKDLVIDGKNTQDTSRVNFTATVNGAFYGPKASELGGYFTYNGKDTTPKNSENSQTVPSSPNSQNARAAVVFGAKKQVETTNK